MSITLEPTTPDTMAMLHHFFLAFFYDLSEYDPKIVINEFGLPTWEPAGLPGPRTAEEFIAINWWIRGSCEQFIIRHHGAPAGYAIVCHNLENLEPGIDQELLDFYIVPKQRRQGVGYQAARKVFDLHTGTWQVFELASNVRAQRFWQRVIHEYTDGKFLNLDNGTQQRFTIGRR